MAAATEPRREPRRRRARPRARLAAAAAAIAITLAVTIYPPMLTGSDGHADHTAAMLAMWSMSAGFVRGTGFCHATACCAWRFPAGPACSRWASRCCA